MKENLGLKAIMARLGGWQKLYRNDYKRAKNRSFENIGCAGETITLQGEHAELCAKISKRNSNKLINN